MLFRSARFLTVDVDPLMVVEVGSDIFLCEIAHIGEELWRQLGGTDSVFHAVWPVADKAAMADDEKEVAVQVNGKTKLVVTVPVDISKEDAIAEGKKALEAAGKLSGTVVKEIYVPGKIINIVVKP